MSIEILTNIKIYKMKKISITFALFLGGVLVSFAQEKTHTITVEIAGMTADKGAVYVSLCNNKELFLKKGFRSEIVKVTDKKATAVFKNIPEGMYAISVFHDENDNKKLDTKRFGIPTEATGCSKGAVGKYGPPKYKDAKFTLTKDEIIPVIVK